MKDDRIPPELSEDHDEIVDLAVALARNEMSPTQATAFRERMASDAVVRAVATPIIEAYQAKPLTDAEFEPKWARFRERSGIADLARLAEKQGAESADLAEYQTRVKGRSRVWVKWVARAAAIYFTAVGLSVGTWLSWEYAYFDRRSTGPDEFLTVLMPDKSTVQLSPSSHIKYHENYSERRLRTVWVEGEAVFDVTPQQGVTYEVMGKVARVFVVGTRFTVQSQGDVTVISVERGMVSVQALDADEEPTGTLKTIKAGARVRVTRAGIVPEVDSIPQPRQP
jgi:ferric-dicitrate binding protein FerR (iron transport regulator)